MQILADIIADERARPTFSYWTLGRMFDEFARWDLPLVVAMQEGPFTPATHDDKHRYER
jgi:hypothetical protein